MHACVKFYFPWMFIDFHVEWNGGGNRRVEVLNQGI